MLERKFFDEMNTILHYGRIHVETMSDVGYHFVDSGFRGMVGSRYGISLKQFMYLISLLKQKYCFVSYKMLLSKCKGTSLIEAEAELKKIDEDFQLVKGTPQEEDAEDIPFAVASNLASLTGEAFSELLDWLIDYELDIAYPLPVFNQLTRLYHQTPDYLMHELQASGIAVNSLEEIPALLLTLQSEQIPEHLSGTDTSPPASTRQINFLKALIVSFQDSMTSKEFELLLNRAGCEETNIFLALDTLSVKQASFLIDAFKTGTLLFEIREEAGNTEPFTSTLVWNTVYAHSIKTVPYSQNVTVVTDEGEKEFVGSDMVIKSLMNAFRYSPSNTSGPEMEVHLITRGRRIMDFAFRSIVSTIEEKAEIYNLDITARYPLVVDAKLYCERKIHESLIDSSEVPDAINHYWVTELFPYQLAAVEKHRKSKAWALLMEMGTGKTPVYLRLGLEKVLLGKAKHIVIIAPVNTFITGSLSEEVEKHTGIVPTIFHGKTYHHEPTMINIIGTESISSSITAIKALEALTPGAAVILDESHMIKNIGAKRSERIMAASKTAAYTCISSGTPSVNGIEDLYTQCTFLSPHVLGYENYKEFQKKHLSLRFDQQVARRINEEYIYRKLAPYATNVNKRDCFTIPAKKYEKRTVILPDDYRNIYRSFKYEMITSYSKWEEATAFILTLRLGLNMITAGVVPDFVHKFVPDAVYNDNPSPKLVACYDILSENPKENSIVWCNFREEVDNTYQYLTSNDIACFCFHGGMNHEERKEALHDFRNTAGSVLIATQATGGTGLNLAFASNSIYLSRTDNYLLYQQSQDRIDRLGSTKSNIYNIFTDMPIEKAIFRNLTSKKEFLKEILSSIKAYGDIDNDTKVSLLKEKVSAW